MERVFGDFTIYWVNLDVSTERRNNMEKNMTNLNHTRISAINGLNNEFKTKYKVLSNPDFSSGLNAAACSHIKAIKMAHDKNLPYVIIMEDKCHFDYIEYFEFSIQDIINMVEKQDPKWDIIQLSSVPLYNLADAKKNGFQIRKRNGNYSGLNYLINYNGMKKILNLIPTDGETNFDFSAVKHFPDPECMIYSSINSYILNIPILYVFAEKSTFQFYYTNKRCRKKSVPLKVIKAKQALQHFYADKITNTINK